MSAHNLLTSISSTIENWLKVPEKNAAGRLGIYRILYSSFYLWYLSDLPASDLAGLPGSLYVNRILLTTYFPKPLTPVIFQGLEVILVTFLFLLLLGFRVRLATLSVLVIGCLIETFKFGLNAERAAVFLVFHIPLAMLFFRSWGDTYSVDSLLRRKPESLTTSPNDSSWVYGLSIRYVLFILAFLWFSSGISKMVSGYWLGSSDMMAFHVLQKNIKAAAYDLPLNPFAVLIAQTPLVHHFLRLFTIFFEVAFISVLLSKELRFVFLSLVLVFHSVNALFFVVTFTPVLIVYGLFVDWQDILQKISPLRINLKNALSPLYLKAISVSLAVFVGISWNATLSLKTLINLGGLVDWRTIWYPVFPLSLAWFAFASLNLARGLFKRRFASKES